MPKWSKGAFGRLERVVREAVAADPDLMGPWRLTFGWQRGGRGIGTQGGSPPSIGWIRLRLRGAEGRSVTKVVRRCHSGDERAAGAGWVGKERDAVLVKLRAVLAETRAERAERDAAFEAVWTPARLRMFGEELMRLEARLIRADGFQGIGMGEREALRSLGHTFDSLFPGLAASFHAGADAMAQVDEVHRHSRPRRGALDAARRAAQAAAGRLECDSCGAEYEAGDEPHQRRLGGTCGFHLDAPGAPQCDGKIVGALP